MNDLLHVILYGNKNFGNNLNVSILTVTITDIKHSESFNEPVFLLLLTLFLLLHPYPFCYFFFKKSALLQVGFLP